MSAGASAPLAQVVAGVNRLVLSAQLVERGALRYTPAGVPAFDLGLKHESQVLEDGLPRRVSLEIRAVAIGEVTRRVGALELGNSGEFAGFLSAGRSGRGLLFHVTALD
ncbi:primosomal replication protein N [Azohydromonas australica]|uniref:primosomal replication protein N n=1 Tax=Azohydromonas australica TaxID=364039 RepID=UPI0003F89D21|nr:primosomal replication protein N [Azohydromonas australica]